MFTGLVEEVGSIKRLDSATLYINCKDVVKGTKIGDSIAVNGACLTVTNIYENYLSFHVSKTTMEHTRFRPGTIRTGDYVNLERALKVNDRLGGHVVQGHVDGIAKIISCKKAGEDTYFEFLYPKELKSLIIKKGSVTIDGVSLTISDIYSSSFAITVIPHTIKMTNLQHKRVGDQVHIEADLFARYIDHILKSGVSNEGNKEIIERFSRW